MLNAKACGRLIVEKRHGDFVHGERRYGTSPSIMTRSKCGVRTSRKLRHHELNVHAGEVKQKF